jgi:hypothetical protein
MLVPADHQMKHPLRHDRNVLLVHLPHPFRSLLDQLELAPEHSGDLHRIAVMAERQSRVHRMMIRCVSLHLLQQQSLER